MIAAQDTVGTRGKRRHCVTISTTLACEVVGGVDRGIRRVFSRARRVWAGDPKWPFLKLFSAHSHPANSHNFSLSDPCAHENTKQGLVLMAIGATLG